MSNIEQGTTECRRKPNRTSEFEIPCSIFCGSIVMLSKILKLLAERGPMSLAEMARSFNSEVSAMEGMLNTLETKGRIERLDTKCSNCKGCIEVKPEDAAIYKAV